MSFGPTSNPAPDTERLMRDLAPRLVQALIALDFDGTLAPLVDDPQTSRPAEGTADVLAALIRAGARVALITGRDAQTAVRLSGLDVLGASFEVAGLYGAEQWRDGVLSRPPEPAALAELRAELPELVLATASANGVWIEDKGLSLVLHLRRANDPGAAHAALTEPVHRLATRLGLQDHPGNMVIELRLPGFDKGTALGELLQRHAPRALLYAGDDLGDIPAFERVAAARDTGLPTGSIAVGNPPPNGLVQLADLVVPTPADLVQILDRLTGRSGP